jgi:hypothetical protein
MSIIMWNDNYITVRDVSVKIDVDWAKKRVSGITILDSEDELKELPVITLDEFEELPAIALTKESETLPPFRYPCKSLDYQPCEVVSGSQVKIPKTDVVGDAIKTNVKTIGDMLKEVVLKARTEKTTQESPVENVKEKPITKKPGKRQEAKLRHEWLKNRLMEYVKLNQPTTLPAGAPDTSPSYQAKIELYNFLNEERDWKIFDAIKALVREGKFTRTRHSAKSPYEYSIGNIGIKTSGNCPRCNRKLEKMNSKYELAAGGDFEFEHCSFCGQDYYPEEVKEIETKGGNDDVE